MHLGTIVISVLTILPRVMPPTEAQKIDHNETVPLKIILPAVNWTTVETKGTPALSANSAAAIPKAPYLAINISKTS